MAGCGKWHKELDENGVGKCSVPMWSMGIPAGFCDQPAFGKHEGRPDSYGGYVPFLACYSHGGPKEKKEQAHHMTDCQSCAKAKWCDVALKTDAFIMNLRSSGAINREHVERLRAAIISYCQAWEEKDNAKV